MYFKISQYFRKEYKEKLEKGIRKKKKFHIVQDEKTTLPFSHKDEDYFKLYYEKDEEKHVDKTVASLLKGGFILKDRNPYYTKESTVMIPIYDKNEDPKTTKQNPIEYKVEKRVTKIYYNYVILSNPNRWASNCYWCTKDECCDYHEGLLKSYERCKNYAIEEDISINGLGVESVIIKVHTERQWELEDDYNDSCTEFIDFVGNNCGNYYETETECRGWLPNSNRCDCGNRRVRWATPEMAMGFGEYSSVDMLDPEMFDKFMLEPCAH